MSRVKLINYYEKAAKALKEDDIDRSYENEHLLNIHLPFRALAIGPSGTGKTNIILSLISLISIWDKVVILAKNLEEKLYRYGIQQIQQIEKKQRRKILLATSDINEIPSVDDFDIKENTLLIVDDFVSDSPKSLALLEPFWIRGRKNGVCPIFISQSYFRTPKMIRQQCDLVFIKKLGNVKDLQRIVREYAMEETPEEISAKYKKTLAGDFTNFFLIDLSTTDPALRFRHCFDPIQ